MMWWAAPGAWHSLQTPFAWHLREEEDAGKGVCVMVDATLPASVIATPTSIVDVMEQCFVDIQRLIVKLWPIAPILRAANPSLGSCLVQQCQQALDVVRLYEAGAAPPEALRRLVEAFNPTLDELEWYLGQTFDALFAYATSCMAQLPTAHATSAQTQQRITDIRAVLAQPGLTIEMLVLCYSQLDEMLESLEWDIITEEEGGDGTS
jgi:hypothetical protein